MLEQVDIDMNKNEGKSQLYSTHKNYFEVDQRLKRKPKTSRGKNRRKSV